MRYRRVSCAFWLDEKVRTLLDDAGRLAFLHLLTCPNMTSVGAMRGTLGAEAADLGWPVRKLQTALRPAIEVGMVEVNTPVAYIGLPNFLRHNPPENPNVAKAWPVALASLPECPQRAALIERCWHALGTRRDAAAFRKAFAEAFVQAFGRSLPVMASPMPSLNPSPIPEPEQESGTGAGVGADAPSLAQTLKASRNGFGRHEDKWAGIPPGVVDLPS